MNTSKLMNLKIIIHEGIADKNLIPFSDMTNGQVQVYMNELPKFYYKLPGEMPAECFVAEKADNIYVLYFQSLHKSYTVEAQDIPMEILAQFHDQETFPGIDIPF